MTEPSASPTIRVFGIDDSDAERAERSPFRKGEELRYGRAEIPVEVFSRRVETFLATMRDVISGLADTAGEYRLDQVQVAVEVSAKGHVSLLGAGGELAGKGGLTFTFTRRG